MLQKWVDGFGAKYDWLNNSYNQVARIFKDLLFVVSNILALSTFQQYLHNGTLFAVLLEQSSTFLRYVFLFDGIVEDKMKLTDLGLRV